MAVRSPASSKQLQQAALVAKALDVRYQVTTAELKRLGITPARVGSHDGVGGPFESAGNSTFKSLFDSWKKLDQLQDGVIAIPSDKPVKTNVEFTSGFGVRSDPFEHGAAMHPGIDLAGAYGTPIYATADGTVLRAGWNSGGYGNLVEIDHGRGITTRYGHMSAILVPPASTSPAASRSAGWARPAARPATTCIMKSGSTDARSTRSRS